MSQQKPPRPELVPPPSKTTPASKPQANVHIPKPAITSGTASEPSPKLSMQAFDVAVALATERLQAAQPQPTPVPAKVTALPTPIAIVEPRVATRRNEPSYPVILIQQSTGLTLPTHTLSVFPRGAVVAVKQRLPEGSVATIVNPGNARSAEGTVLWCDGSSAEIEFREAIPTFWQPEAGTSSAPVRTSPEAPREVPPAKQSDVVSIAESIDFAKPVELKLVPPSSSSPEATSAAAQLFGEQTYQRRNVRPFVIAITAIALLSGIGTSGIVLSKLHQGAALPSLPVSLPMEKTEAVQPSPVSPNPTSIAVQGVAETKLESTARHASTAPSAAVVAVNAPSKIITAANEGPAPDASSDFAISMPAPPPVISSAVKNVVLAAPDPVHYTAAKPISTPQPAYPEGAKRMGAEGDVVVNVEIDASGQVTATRARSGHPLLIEPAVSAARLWKFEPATRNGKPIASLKTLRFHFTAH